ncbi:hypothetical protein [Sulfuracidifex metallicus]|jgi:hypothetical protein|uniref:Uncharacterized protein n=1 Tax=Sulfuracidifex metallicus DSM 6482 = JCM 9184 TaxID=523847 RepID=A0A6A9QP12_SULME|nr:hypothetical protein [Sulfuracidifex metallicus]MUN28921.1 hypothetical protein [Sulfuracidifex metallicus DSM 6482 = JCM 9184]WOE50570.1 hypothetical protein RQ359_002112 [Sulfuracidifex metallicus DSM 6482 = JCM 9184]
MKGKEILGELNINQSGKVIGHAGDIENPEEIGEIISYNLKKGMEEAKDLGFSSIHGFAMIGSERSLAFMKGKALILDTKQTSWQDIFLGYVFSKWILILGIVVTILALGIMATGVFTNIFTWFSLNSRLYFSIAALIVGISLIFMSKSELSYRL